MTVGWAGPYSRSGDGCTQTGCVVESEVIATTSRGKAALGIIIILVFGALVIDMWRYAAADFQYYFSSQFRRWTLLGATAGLLAVVPLAAGGLRQMVYHGRRIVWIENERLIYYDPFFFSVPCADIAALLPVQGFMKRDAIAVITRDGRRKEFAAFGMSIPRDNILKRLRDVLGLKHEPASFR
jgi:hypothetical protein